MQVQALIELKKAGKSDTHIFRHLLEDMLLQNESATTHDEFVAIAVSVNAKWVTVARKLGRQEGAFLTFLRSRVPEFCDTFANVAW